MQTSIVEVNQVWRHLCPMVEDLNIDCKIIEGGVYIEIPRHLRIQGLETVHPTLVLYGTQNGFLCSHISVTAPTHGTLSYDGKGWWYNISGTVTTTTTDSFKYVLSTYHQRSLEATITIKFK